MKEKHFHARTHKTK